MKPSTAALVVSTLWAACTMMSCGGVAADGGQSGTGISAVRGNVVGVQGQQLDVADIRVSLAESELETHTDAGGRFELQGEVSGPVELRFERARDELFARADVVVPAGGVLELADIVIDRESGEARPTMRRVEFEGRVTALNCVGGSILITATEDDAADTVFSVQVASATIRHDDTLLECTDLRVNDRVEVDAETSDGLMLTHAEIVLEDREEGSGEDTSEVVEREPEDDLPKGGGKQPDDAMEQDEGDDVDENAEVTPGHGGGS